MIRQHGLIGLALAVATVLLVAPVPGAAAVTESEAVRMIEQTYNVEVLRARAGTIEGRQVWLLTVMNQGGDFNTAFQVNTLAVDQDTGKLVPAFRHGPSGVSSTGAEAREE